jgi:dihydrofolate reductase
LDDEFVRTGNGDSGAVMARLIYASNVSLDGCTEDERGAFDWAPPDDEVFAFITELMRSAGTYLYGRRMYETMAVWETDSSLAAQSDLTADYAKVWQAADKVVYSSSLAAPSTANTRLERHFDPSAVQDLKAAASRDLLVGGPNVAAQALVAGLVDELQLFVWPVVLGGRKAALPTDMRADLELLDEHRFSNGVVQLRYRLCDAEENRDVEQCPITAD